MNDKRGGQLAETLPRASLVILCLFDGILGVFELLVCSLDARRIGRTGMLGSVELVLRDLNLVARRVESVNGREMHCSRACSVSDRN